MSDHVDSFKSKKLLDQAFGQKSEDCDCKINLLNIHCLDHIFSFLSPRELINVERVCKFWQLVSLKSWRRLKHVSSINLITTCRKHRNYTMEEKTLECILKRCGPYVETLRIEHQCQGLALIPKYCSALRVLHVLNGIQHLECDPCILENCIRLSVCCIKNSIEVQNLFKIFPNIYSLEVSSSAPISEDCFKFLNVEVLCELQLECKIYDNGHLSDYFNRMKELLSLKVYHGLTSRNTIMKILKALPKVPVNCLSNTENPTSCDLDSFIGLSLPGASLNDKFIQQVVAIHDTLEFLNIERCRNITPRGIAIMTSLRNLEYLNLNYVRSNHEDVVLDEHLQQLAMNKKLVQLEIMGNSKVTDKGCSKVLSLCPDLQHFNLQGCSLITDATLDSAKAAVKCRSNNTNLKLFVGGTRITKNWNDLPPLLTLDFDDPDTNDTSDESDEA